MSAESAGDGARPAILQIEGLQAGYADVNILHDVSITVPQGAIVSVIGPNGAGKSTLLKTIYGFLPPRAGRIVYRPPGDGEHELGGMKPNRITELGLSYVPQLANVFPSMTVLENLELGAFLQPERTAESLERVYGWFPRLHERRRQRAGTLSGGERQMLALGRALMLDPRLILLDEPSAGLAPLVVDAIFEKIQQISEETGLSVVMVEQNARRSLAMSDYGYVLDLGRNRYEGPGRKLMHDPEVVELYLGGRGRFGAAADEDYEAAAEPEPAHQARRRFGRRR